MRRGGLSRDEQAQGTMTDPTLPDNGTIRRVESATIDSYEIYLKDKHRPPSRGGNGRAWHSHVIKIGEQRLFLPRARLPQMGLQDRHRQLRVAVGPQPALAQHRPRYV